MTVFNSAKLLSDARQNAGLSQVELARLARTSQPAIARYENGSAEPSMSTLLRLLRAAGYDLDIKVHRSNGADLSGERARKVRNSKGAIRKIMKKAGATNIRLFGSVARGQDSANSDIDFLVDFDISNGLLPIIGLNAELSELLGERVDVSPTGALKAAVLKRALSEAVPL